MKPRTTAILAAAALAAALATWAWFSGWFGGETLVGFARANGRIEVARVDIASKYDGRIASILVHEGDPVTAGMVVAQMDTSEIEARLTEAKALARQAAQAIRRAEAEAAQRVADAGLAEVELKRARYLESRDAGTVADVDRRTAERDVAVAAVDSARAAVGDAEAAKEAAEARVAALAVVIAEMKLVSPVSGRVEYRLGQPGTVIGAGERVATVLDLSDVHMTVFLPAGEAGALAIGEEARIVLDAAPGYVFPARIAFVASEAQFTPKTVETSDERQKLVYRVKLSADPELLATYRDQIKAGLTGDAWVRLDPAAAWPEKLAVRLPDAH
ncbi:HlyD family efflux transporter periplasmic adaptor subunit [Aestuariivirga sp.]|uniref:HlyD family secretion protein n=1 Tax=Aestuariivirga sp. TaxID=2650926 RepID=UPI0025BECF38|nr:HlyD family efflux transporter periplasmic adaptor subunit [Aestuariivirga sp.]